MGRMSVGSFRTTTAGVMFDVSKAQILSTRSASADVVGESCSSSLLKCRCYYQAKILYFVVIGKCSELHYLLTCHGFNGLSVFLF